MKKHIKEITTKEVLNFNNKAIPSVIAEELKVLRKGNNEEMYKASSEYSSKVIKSAGKELTDAERMELVSLGISWVITSELRKVLDELVAEFEDMEKYEINELLDMVMQQVEIMIKGDN